MKPFLKDFKEFREKSSKERKKTPSMYKLPINMEQTNEIGRKKNIGISTNNKDNVISENKMIGNMTKLSVPYIKMNEIKNNNVDKIDSNRNSYMLSSSHLSINNFKNKTNDIKNTDINDKNRMKLQGSKKTCQKDVSDDDIMCEEENIENIKPNNLYQTQKVFNMPNRPIISQKIRQNVKKDLPLNIKPSSSSSLLKKNENRTDNKSLERQSDRHCEDKITPVDVGYKKSDDVRTIKRDIAGLIKPNSSKNDQTSTLKQEAKSKGFEEFKEYKSYQTTTALTMDENNFGLACDESIIPSPRTKNKKIKKSMNEPQKKKMTLNEEERGVCVLDSNSLNYLIKQEMIYYTPDPFYLNNKNVTITWIMRSILCDWMMEVCTEFTLKRETFHLSVSYVDRYLTKKYFIDKRKLQLIGLASMYVAAKIEEIYAPKMVDFMKSANNAYQKDEIRLMEQELLIELKYMLNPPTINLWTNWYMSQWDLYLDQLYSSKSPFHQFLKVWPVTTIKFKQPNEESYLLYREFLQILDCSMLDIQTLQYKNRTLVASLIYLIMGKKLKRFGLNNIISEFPYSSSYLLNPESEFNSLFSGYLNYCFGFELVELLPSIQYLATYFGLNIVNNLPTVAKLNKEYVLESHFEDFLAFQTHNPYNLETIKIRNRNL